MLDHNKNEGDKMEKENFKELLNENIENQWRKYNYYRNICSEDKTDFEIKQPEYIEPRSFSLDSGISTTAGFTFETYTLSNLGPCQTTFSPSLVS